MNYFGGSEDFTITIEHIRSRYQTLINRKHFAKSNLGVWISIPDRIEQNYTYCDQLLSSFYGRIIDEPNLTELLYWSFNLEL